MAQAGKALTGRSCVLKHRVSEEQSAKAGLRGRFGPYHACAPCGHGVRGPSQTILVNGARTSSEDVF